MSMLGQFELQDPMAEEFIRDLAHVVADGTYRKSLYKRQSRDGVGYTWNEFLWWYDNQPQLAFERWCEAPSILAPMALRHTDAPYLGPIMADILYQSKSSCGQNFSFMTCV